MEKELFCLAWLLPEKSQKRASATISTGRHSSPVLIQDCGKLGYTLCYLFFKLAVTKTCQGCTPINEPLQAGLRFYQTLQEMCQHGSQREASGPTVESTVVYVHGKLLLLLTRTWISVVHSENCSPGFLLAVHVCSQERTQDVHKQQIWRKATSV